MRRSGMAALAAAAQCAAGPARAESPPPAIPAHRQANDVAVLSVEGQIDRITLWSLERRMRQAVDAGADAIVLELDTPGGDLDATRDITHLLKTDAPVNTVAWINPEAYSAGTIIALACREIVVAPGSSFGDAAPIRVGPMGLAPLAPAERAKIESPILEDVVDSARRNHYDENLVKAFVSVGVELWLIENLQSGERVFVDRAEYEAVFGEPPPQDLTPLAGSGPGAGDPPVRPWFNTVIPQESGPAPDPAAVDQAVALAQTLPPARPRLTAAARGQWKPLTQVISSDQLLIVKAGAARFYGLAQATIASEAELRAFFGAQTLRRYDASWSEGLVRFLTHPIVMGVLIVIFLVCLFVEMASPGVGVFGATALVSALLLLGAPYLVGMAQWWDLLLVAMGVVLVAVELLLIPGFGVAGVVGVLALLIGLIGTFVTGDLGSPQAQGQLVTGLITTLTAFFVAGIGVWLLARHLESFPLLDRIVLRAQVGDEAGRGILASMQAPPQRLEPGTVGSAATDLRPAGRGRFGASLVDVQSGGAYVPQGAPIRVVSADRFQIIVEEVE
jgi:membrane-bound ClpP family serine protease